jgi:sugar O-acyltransferase (sialic acid O-acetyltransferase NeuD family)
MNVVGEGAHAKVLWDVIGSKSLLIFDGTVIGIGDNAKRKAIVDITPTGCWSRALVHARAYVSDLADLGEGTVVMAGAIIQPGAKIGKHCIINTGATVDHDCVLEDYVHIAPGAHLCGNVHVGEGTLVGVGVGIAPNTVIPAWSLVKARRLEIEPL